MVSLSSRPVVLTLRIHRKCFRNLLEFKEVSYEFTVLNELSDTMLVKNCFVFLGNCIFQLSVNQMILRAIGIKQTRVNLAKIKKCQGRVVMLECLFFQIVREIIWFLSIQNEFNFNFSALSFKLFCAQLQLYNLFGINLRSLSHWAGCSFHKYIINVIYKYTK